jgi:hypothetical protein
MLVVLFFEDMNDPKLSSNKIMAGITIKVFQVGTGT